jgi:hypothetical protein
MKSDMLETEGRRHSGTPFIARHTRLTRDSALVPASYLEPADSNRIWQKGQKTFGRSPDSLDQKSAAWPRKTAKIGSPSFWHRTQLTYRTLPSDVPVGDQGCECWCWTAGVALSRASSTMGCRPQQPVPSVSQRWLLEAHGREVSIAPRHLAGDDQSGREVWY